MHCAHLEFSDAWKVPARIKGSRGVPQLATGAQPQFSVSNNTADQRRKPLAECSEQV